MNDGIAEDLCSLQYSSVDNAVQFITSLGQGTQLVKLDLKDAYRILPIHPQDHHLPGIRWQDQIYIDRSLPFGLRSAPKIFSAFADMVAWCIHCQGVHFLMHYLDDFLILGAPGTQEAAVALDTVQYFLTTAGIPVANNKTEGPTTTLSFLGILIDSVRFELRLPADKLANLVALVSQWRRKKERTTVLYWPPCPCGDCHQTLGVFFCVRCFHYWPVSAFLNGAVRADIQWWHCFLKSRNGSSFFPSPTPSIHIYSDTSGTFACGVIVFAVGWFQLHWPVK